VVNIKFLLQVLPLGGRNYECQTDYVANFQQIYLCVGLEQIGSRLV